MFKYYGVDWFLFGFILCHIWLLGNQKKLAFPFAIAGCICGIIFGYMTESVATMLMNIIFILMHIRSYYKWSNNEQST